MFGFQASKLWPSMDWVDAMFAQLSIALTLYSEQGSGKHRVLRTTGIEAASRYDTISRHLLARGNSVARISTNDLVRLSAERTWCGRWAISLGGRANSVWRGRGESIASGTAA
jgi:hypothetical protein